METVPFPWTKEAIETLRTLSEIMEPYAPLRHLVDSFCPTPLPGLNRIMEEKLASWCSYYKNSEVKCDISTLDANHPDYIESSLREEYTPVYVAKCCAKLVSDALFSILCKYDSALPLWSNYPLHILRRATGASTFGVLMVVVAIRKLAQSRLLYPQWLPPLLSLEADNVTLSVSPEEAKAIKELLFFGLRLYHPPSKTILRRRCSNLYIRIVLSSLLSFRRDWGDSDLNPPQFIDKYDSVEGVRNALSSCWVCLLLSA